MLYTFGAEPISVLDGGRNWLRTNLYAAGKLLATYDSLGVHYALTDWLGIKRMQISSTGDALAAFILSSSLASCSLNVFNFSTQVHTRL